MSTKIDQTSTTNNSRHHGPGIVLISVELNGEIACQICKETMIQDAVTMNEMMEGIPPDGFEEYMKKCIQVEKAIKLIADNTPEMLSAFHR